MVQCSGIVNSTPMHKIKWNLITIHFHSRIYIWKCLQNVGHFVQASMWTYWGRVMYICVSRLTIIGSDNGLTPGRHQAIMWTIAGKLFIGPLGFHWNLNQNSYILIQEMHLKMSSRKCWPFYMLHGKYDGCGFRITTSLSPTLNIIWMNANNLGHWKWVSNAPKLEW